MLPGNDAAGHVKSEASAFAYCISKFGCAARLDLCLIVAIWRSSIVIATTSYTVVRLQRRRIVTLSPVREETNEFKNLHPVLKSGLGAAIQTTATSTSTLP